MRFQAAKQRGRTRPVRQKDWLTRFVRWEGAYAYLMPFDPYRRTWGPERIVRAEDVSVAWWKEEWTDEPVPVAEYYPATCHVAHTAPGAHTMYGFVGYSSVRGHTPIYLRWNRYQRQFEETLGTWKSPTGNWNGAIGYTATRGFSRDSLTVNEGGQIDPETDMMSSSPLPSEGEKTRESFVYRVETHTPPAVDFDHAWTVRQFYPDLENVVEGTPPWWSWWQDFSDLVNPLAATWEAATVLEVGDSTDVIQSADVRQTKRERVWHYLRQGSDEGAIRSLRIDIDRTQLFDEYTPNALRLRAISACGAYGAELEGLQVASLAASTESRHVPSAVWTGVFHPYLRYQAICGRYRLSADIPVYDGHGGYLFQWRVSGGGWDEHRTAEVIPALGSSVCSTPLMEIHPLALGEVRIEDCYAVFNPSLS